MQSLRLTVLEIVAQVLRRWLKVVTAQLAPAADPSTPLDYPAESGQPAPPQHWVELVRQHAPQLLEPDTTDQSGVIEWRSEEAFVPQRTARPLRLQPPMLQPPAAAPPVVKSLHRRPLRLQQVVTQSLGTEEIRVQSAGTESDQVKPPIRSTRLSDTPKVNIAPMPDEVEALEYPPYRVPHAPAQPISKISTLPGESETVKPHFSNTPFERQHLRETYTSLPKAADVSTTRTRSAGSVQPTERRTSVPQAPPQHVLRPTTTPAPLSAEDVSAERWPSLPDEPAEAARDSADRQRRERLRREQEGRLWSE